MSEAIKEVLKKNHMSVTDSRLQILGLFYKSTGALAHADIEKKTSDKVDRVTIYRTLQTFEEKGLIHSIPTADNSVKYALCKEACEEGHHHDNHVHFICDECGKTICLDDVLVPEVKLPKGFEPQQSNMVVNGICGECRG
ncbi:MAG: transcriptional repressor [Chitinophagaceae bacterium]|nr:transcriptional repressor [Chitinophagaceae bacterium]